MADAPLVCVHKGYILMPKRVRQLFRWRRMRMALSTSQSEVIHRWRQGDKPHCDNDVISVSVRSGIAVTFRGWRFAAYVDSDVRA